MDINWLSIVVPAITAIIVAALMSVLPSWIAKWRSPEEEEKDRATAAGVISEASIRMVERWEARVEELEQTVRTQAKQIETQAKQIEQLETKATKQGGLIDEMEKEARSLHIENISLAAQAEVFKKGAGKLREQVTELGHVPIWVP